MKQRPIILLDLDDTLNEFSETYWNLYNEQYETNITPEQSIHWDLAKTALPETNPYALFKHPGIFRSIKLKPYAPEFVERLQQHFDVYIVTDAPEGTDHLVAQDKPFSNPTDDKRAWIKEQLPTITNEQIIIASSKWMIYGDILLDDKPATFEKFTELGRTCLLMDAPFNRYIETENRVCSLREAEARIYELMNVKKDGKPLEI